MASIPLADPAIQTDRALAVSALGERGKRLLNELSALRKHRTPESVHDTRVASRRMRAAMEAFREHVDPRVWRVVYARVKFVTRALGQAREAEVIAELAGEVACGGDLAENLCREYLQQRLTRKLDRKARSMNRELSRLDLRDLRRGFRGLLSTPATVRHPRQAGTAHASVLKRSVVETAALKLIDLAGPILSFDARRHFSRASDERLHNLRIAVKRFRYALELFDPAWPGGLAKEMELSRRVQEAAGTHHDWTVLHESMRREIRRLTREQTSQLAFQLGRLLARADAHRREARSEILAPLVAMQASVRALLADFGAGW